MWPTPDRSSSGKWTVKVIPDPDGGDILGWNFRMRAKLEGAPSTPQNTRQLPNLRAIPPFELTFCEPLVTAGFLAGNTPVCGSDSNGLTKGEEADLIADEPPSGTIKLHRALRFSTGPENLGDGFMEIRTHPEDPGNVVLPDPDDPNTFTLRHVAFQRFYIPDGTPVYKADGITPDDREVGTMEFHQAHGHWHYQFFIYELYELTRIHPTEPWKKIKLGQRTVGKKVGFCPSDEHLADFSRFYQLRRGRWIDDRFEEDPTLLPFEFLGGNCISPDRPMMGITPGWGDLYEWARVEQFVEFPINLDGSPRDGYYLLRATVDATLDGAGSLAAGPLLESNEKDNTSYTFFNVTNGAIKIIRSGYGLEP